MNTLDLEHAIKSNKITRKNFVGVLSRNQLPSSISFPSHFILNTQNSNQRGEHWLGLFYDVNGHCSFFDSYGNSPQYFNLLDFIKKTSNSYDFNNLKIQNFSTYCGIYCIFFVYCKNLGYSTLKIKNLYKAIQKRYNSVDFYFKKFILKFDK
jgi:hypothetical protein